MATGPLVNCDFCGRDTRNKSRICRVCTGGRNGAMKHSRTLRMTDKWDDLSEDEKDECRDLLVHFGLCEERTRDSDVDDEVSDALNDLTS